MLGRLGIVGLRSYASAKAARSHTRSPSGEGSSLLMSWAPSAEGLQQLVGLFKASRSADNQQHRAIQQQLVEFNVIPDYNNYLAYILRDPHPDGLDRHSGAVEGAVRQLAGLTLKNNTKEHWNKVQPEVQQYVRSILLDCVGDSEQYIRMVVGSCITTIVYAGGLETWPDLVPTLFSMLSHQDPITVRGALSALNKICEDSPEKLAKDVTTQPLNSLIPKFLEFLGNPDPELRKSALHCLNHFVLLMPPALRQHIDTFLQALFALATDTVGDVRKCVCQALVMLLEVAPEKLQPMMPNIVQYMLQACGDEDETVALEACEFWPAICETKMAQEALGGVLPQLVPVLLKGMVYSEVRVHLCVPRAVCIPCTCTCTCAWHGERALDPPAVCVLLSRCAACPSPLAPARDARDPRAHVGETCRRETCRRETCRRDLVTPSDMPMTCAWCDAPPHPVAAGGHDDPRFG